MTSRFSSFANPRFTEQTNASSAECFLQFAQGLRFIVQELSLASRLVLLCQASIIEVQGPRIVNVRTTTSAAPTLVIIAWRYRNAL